MVIAKGDHSDSHIYIHSSRPSLKGVYHIVVRAACTRPCLGLGYWQSTMWRLGTRSAERAEMLICAVWVEPETTHPQRSFLGTVSCCL